jgi:hypothetical protein
MTGIEIPKVLFPEEVTNGQPTVDKGTIIKNLTNTKSSRFDIGSGDRLTVENSFEIPSNINMQFVGSGSGTMQINDTLKLSGTVKFIAPNYTFDNGTIALNGGTLESSDDTTIASNIQHLNNSTIVVDTGKTMTYSGDVLEIGNNALSISGGGIFYNTSSINLNHEGSVLKLDGISKIEHVTFGENLSDGFLDVDQNSKIQTISHLKSSKLDIADQTNLTVVNFICCSPRTEHEV